MTPRFSWVDKQTYSIFNNIYAPQYHRTDYFLSWTASDNTWKLIAYLKNAEGDDSYTSATIGSAASGGFATPNSLYAGYNPPRQYGLEVLVRY